MNITELSLTQQFSIRAFETHVDKMSLEQSQHFLKELYKQMMVRDAMYQELLRKEWETR